MYGMCLDMIAYFIVDINSFVRWSLTKIRLMIVYCRFLHLKYFIVREIDLKFF